MNGNSVDHWKYDILLMPINSNGEAQMDPLDGGRDGRFLSIPSQKSPNINQERSYTCKKPTSAN
jgi:hypothetical protein